MMLHAMLRKCLIALGYPSNTHKIHISKVNLIGNWYGILYIYDYVNVGVYMYDMYFWICNQVSMFIDFLKCFFLLIPVEILTGICCCLIVSQKNDNTAIYWLVLGTSVGGTTSGIVYLIFIADYWRVNAVCDERPS